jgi:hypothetical protein
VPADSPTGGEEGKSLRWQGTLVELWRLVHAKPEFTALRAAAALPPSQPPPQPEAATTSATPAAAAAAAAPLAGTPDRAGVSLAAAAPPTSIVPSIPDVLARLKAEAGSCSRPTDVHVLVTGSLYLVGGLLEAAGWTEDAAAPTG